LVNLCFATIKSISLSPANIGIICAISFTHDAWVSPGQWGNDWWYLLVFAGTGAMILKKVGRFETSAAFFLTYGALAFARNAYLGWEIDVVLHQLMSGSLLLFALFMLTDPRSIPNARTGRLLWSIAIAVISFVLQYQFYVNTAIFWTLFIMSPLTIVIDRYWNGRTFNWTDIVPHQAMERTLNA
ncbi:MAG: hypothetical protein HC796_04165, partial [Synechococcaceae cyanobacterium RL_1_2]|nr:hypothetical protein [Synechococcaceae cyanobacterium RL_1_2]